VPKVSVNICCYNSKRFIKETIESVLTQTFNDFEVIIINDGSIDSTEEIIKKFGDPRIRYFYQENRGLSTSRNKAISLAKGEYIALLDHDDLWEPEKLKLQVEFLDKNPAVGIISSDGHTISENNKILKRFSKINRFYRGKIVNQLIEKYWIVCSTVMMRKELLNETNWFRSDFKIAEEYDLFLRLALNTEFDYINKPLIKYRFHAGNTSKNEEKLYQEEIRIILDLNRNENYKIFDLAITRRLSRLYTELAIIYSLKKEYEFAKDAIGQALNRKKNNIFALVICGCLCLPLKLSLIMVWSFKKTRSAWRRISVAI